MNTHAHKQHIDFQVNVADMRISSKVSPFGTSSVSIREHALHRIMLACYRCVHMTDAEVDFRLHLIIIQPSIAKFRTNFSGEDIYINR